MGRKRRRGNSVQAALRSAIAAKAPHIIERKTADSVLADSIIVTPFNSGTTNADLERLKEELGLATTTVPIRRSPPPPHTPVPEAPKLPLRQQWREDFRNNLELFPAAAKSTMSIRKSGFIIDDVYKNGTVVGRSP